MPLYDYQCQACQKVTEVRHGFKETHDAACQHCGGKLARVFNPAGIVFKGSGFYINDSRKSPPSESTPSETKKAPSEAKTSDTPAA